MTEIRVIEGSDGVAHVITVFQKGSATAEDLSAYSTATMVVKTRNRQTTIVDPSSTFLNFSLFMSIFAIARSIFDIHFQ